MITKNLKIVFVLITIILVTSLAQLFVNNGFVGTGSKLSKVEQQIKEVRRENLLLKEEIFDGASLKKLSVEAYNLGFTKPEQVVYWDVNTPLALLSITQSR